MFIDGPEWPGRYRIFSVSVDMLLSKLKVTVGSTAFVLPACSGRVVSSGGVYPQKKKIEKGKIKRTRWPSDRPIPSNSLLWKLGYL
jgi:hypothetical protein